MNWTPWGKFYICIYTTQCVVTAGSCPALFFTEGKQPWLFLFLAQSLCQCSCIHAKPKGQCTVLTDEVNHNSTVYSGL